MFIAFEGPDNVGKSTSAARLATDGQALYNATKAMHRTQQERINPEPDLVVTYDRIDWFSHMVYRLALPDHEWNDDRPRTVFAMPDTHLVVKLHQPELAELIDDELYSTGTLALVNPMYYYFADFLMGLNRQREYALFRPSAWWKCTTTRATPEPGASGSPHSTARSLRASTARMGPLTGPCWSSCAVKSTSDSHRVARHEDHIFKIGALIKRN